VFTYHYVLFSIDAISIKLISFQYLSVFGDHLLTSKKKTDSANSEDEKPSIEEVQERLDEISDRLARLEELIERVGPGIEEVRSSAKVIREGFEFYDGMVRLMSKFTKAERLESRYGDLKKDDISWRIIQILDNSSRPLNISQITAGVRAERGTASRRIVRERVNDLVSRGILQIIEDEDERARYFALTNE
jgi:predicted nuclease with TOPRIM domain